MQGCLCCCWHLTKYFVQCPTNYVDETPNNPGRECRSTIGVNECSDPALFQCSLHSRCIDQDYLYRCECEEGYIVRPLAVQTRFIAFLQDSSPKNSTEVPNSPVCVVDYCAGTNACPLNTTCISTSEVSTIPIESTLTLHLQGKKCECIEGFVDLRNVNQNLRKSQGLEVSGSSFPN